MPLPAPVSTTTLLLNLAISPPIQKVKRVQRKGREGTQRKSKKNCTWSNSGLLSRLLQMDVQRAMLVRRSIQLSNQAIDGNQKSESNVQRHQRNKHQFRHFDAYYSRCKQKNNRANETNKRSSDAGRNF